MLKKEFPILEFDSDKNAFIRPKDIIKPIDVTERCVLCFFEDAIEKVLSESPNKIVAHLNVESMNLPLYELTYKGEKIALMQAMVGAPVAAAQIEELTALGCKKYIGCGGCGVLEKEIAVGHLMIPVSAVRDEGTSYHYLAPSREVFANEHAVSCIEKAMKRWNLPYIKVKTWTTDAFYRETPAKIQQRKEEGCVTVEMEASAYMAVAQYNEVSFGQILYAGDNLGGDVWDNREWDSRTDIREQVLRVSLDACLEL